MKAVARITLILIVLALLADGLYRLFFWQHDRQEFSGPLVSLVDKIDSTGIFNFDEGQYTHRLCSIRRFMQ